MRLFKLEHMVLTWINEVMCTEQGSGVSDTIITNYEPGECSRNNRPGDRRDENEPLHYPEELRFVFC